MKSLPIHTRVARLVVLVVGLTTSHAGWAEDIAGWGTVINPDGDCRIEEGNGVVTFTLPERRHDLWYGGRDPATRFNSPRVLQQVTGDFVATVRVTAYWDRGIVDGGYNGAGLVVWDSEKQYLRHERNRMNNGRGTYSYTCPLYDQNNRRVYYIATEKEFFQGNSTWLRLSRSGSMIRTEISHEGQQWLSTGVISSAFPDTVRVGIHSTNSTGKAFAVRYDQFSITPR